MAIVGGNIGVTGVVVAMVMVVEEEDREVMITMDRRNRMRAMVATQEGAIGLHCRQIVASALR